MKILKKIKILAYNYSYWICSILIILFALYLLYNNWISAPDFWELMDEDKQQILEIHSQIVRNRGWLVWMFFSIFGLSIICWVLLLNISVHMKFPIIWLILVAISSTAIYFFLWEWISNFYGLSKKPIQGEERHSQIVRNLGWILWMIISFLGLSIGLWLAIWGRQIQHKSHLQERYEKAAAMLGNEVMPVRVAGCRALMSLGKEDKSMKIQCVRLLFAFINNPYLKETEQNEDINVLFSDVNKPLRLDIQEAVNSFSAIYNHYGKKGIDDEKIVLPSYFWTNRCKGRISLIRANLFRAEMKDAYLFRAKLQGANLWAVNLQGANLYEADLRGVHFRSAKLQEANFEEANLKGASLLRADITNAKMEKARNLTKNQILSAMWGVYNKLDERPPSLPDEIENDPEVQKWLAISEQDKRKKYYKKLKEEGKL